MAWNKNKIAEGVLAPDLNDEIRINWAALEAALDAWNRFATGGTQTGQPRQGSARVYFQDAVPTARLDGEYFDSTDLGCIWIDTNTDPDNQFNILTAADGAGTETWTSISTEIIAVLLASARVFGSTLGVTGDFAVNTDKFTVAAASGNTLIAGTLDVAGNIDPTTFETTNGGFLDEDAMGSDAADKVASQQSIKKYIDDRKDPTYSGGESHTFDGGLIIKMGYSSAIATGSSLQITFGVAFPNALVSVVVTRNVGSNESTARAPRIYTQTTSSFYIYNYSSSTIYVNWQAMGY